MNLNVNDDSFEEEVAYSNTKESNVDDDYFDDEVFRSYIKEWFKNHSPNPVSIINKLLLVDLGVQIILLIKLYLF